MRGKLTSNTFRALSFRLGILVALIATHAGSAAASDNTFLASIASAVESAPRVEAFRLSCRDTSDRVIHLGVERVVGQAADLDSTARSQLVDLLRAVSRDSSDCQDYRCGPCPSYRLVIRDREPPIDMMITQGCTGWSFSRGGVRLASQSYCFYLRDAFLPALRAVIEKIYGPQPEN